MSLASRARILNFLIPGAGMCLLRKWRLAVVNFVLAIAGVAAALTMGGFFAEEIHYVLLAIASGSAGWAHAVAANLSEADMPSLKNQIDPTP